MSSRAGSSTAPARTTRRARPAANRARRAPAGRCCPRRSSRSPRRGPWRRRGPSPWTCRWSRLLPARELPESAARLRGRRPRRRQPPQCRARARRAGPARVAQRPDSQRPRPRLPGASCERLRAQREPWGTARGALPGPEAPFAYRQHAPAHRAPRASERSIAPYHPGRERGRFFLAIPHSSPRAVLVERIQWTLCMESEFIAASAWKGRRAPASS